MSHPEYSGTDNLEAMLEADNYNSYLVSLILADAKKNEITVDFGAGVGTFSIAMVNSGYEIYCVETDARLSEILRAKGLVVYNQLESLDDQSVDYIFSLNVLEHINEDEKILSLWFQKLRPNGRIMIYVPAFPLLFTKMDSKVGHVRRYTKNELARKVSAAGFTIRKLHYVDSLGFIITLLYRCMGRTDGGISRVSLIIYDRIIFPVSRMVDCVMRPLFGKNLYVTATKKDVSVPTH